MNQIKLIEEEPTFTDPKIKNVHHWWEFVVGSYCKKFDSVKYAHVNDTKNGERLTTQEVGLRWIILSLFKLDDLEAVMCHIFNERDFLQLYDKDRSFLWNDRDKILESIAHLKCLDLYNPFYKSDILNKFIQYRNFKEEEKRNKEEEKRGSANVSADEQPVIKPIDETVSSNPDNTLTQ